MPNQNKQEEWKEIWDIIKEDSLASSKIGYPSDKTIVKIISLLQQEREKAVMEKVEDIRDLEFFLLTKRKNTLT